MTLLIVIPSLTYAPTDITTLEAYINDHKNVRTCCWHVQLWNSTTHCCTITTKQKPWNTKELNVDLDKYTRAFDVIDVLYNFAYL